MTDSEVFETEIKCIQRRSSGQCNGGSDCCNCDLLMSDEEIISAYERAIEQMKEKLFNAFLCLLVWVNAIAMWILKVG